MKTLLLWGVETHLARDLAYQLSVNGHRLLVTGADFDKLQELDATLCQSELHRVGALVVPRAVAEWVSEQHLGLDGVVVFPPSPEPGALLTPLTANLRRVERSVLTVVELLRELVPQLRRGKRPKRVLVVLEWDTGLPNPHVESLVNLWQTLVTALADELSHEGVQLNVLYTSPDEVEPAPTLGAEITPAPRATRAEEETAAPEPTVTNPSATAVFAAGWFSEALSALNGQFVHHPNRQALQPGFQRLPGARHAPKPGR